MTCRDSDYPVRTRSESLLANLGADATHRRQRRCIPDSLTIENRLQNSYFLARLRLLREKADPYFPTL